MKTVGLSFAPERLSQLVEALPVGVFILDRGGNAVYANRSAQALLGRGIVPGEHANDLAENYQAVIAGTNDPYPIEQMPIVRALSGERTTVEDMEILRNGERVALEVTATPIVDESGSVVCAVAVFQDITERRRMQELLEQRVAERTSALAKTVDDLIAATAAAEHASKAKSLFLMNVSHELRTPLNHVIGFSELLAERLDDPRSRRLAETATASGRELLDKIDGLIELARAETETASHSVTTFSFDDLLRDVSSTCAVPKPIGMMTANRDLVRRLLEDILPRCTNAQAVADGGRVLISAREPTLAERLRTLATLFGEMAADDHRRFQQQQIDLRLAITRAQARAIGGDLSGSDGETVTLALPIGNVTA